MSNPVDPSQDATQATIDAIKSTCSGLNFNDKQDYTDAGLNLIGPPALSTPFVINNKNGDKVWSMETYANQDPNNCPHTVNNSLWRLATINNNYGLFQVCKGIYQVRGYDLSNMTIVHTSDTGLTIIDPLISNECAAAALELYRKNVGDTKRTVKALIYTHSHVDHFGGAAGVLEDGFDINNYQKTLCPQIVAPEGFLEHAVSENLYCGPAMGRRAQYMYGAYLPVSDKGQVDAGLGKTQSTGTVSLIAPNITVSNSDTFKMVTVDGMDLWFQPTPGTEAPAEFNIWFPEWNALCIAENATHNMHNILTLRGALVRDALAWSKYLMATLQKWGGEVNVMFAQHHWPTFDNDKVVNFLKTQRDLYRYMHDQTLRLLNCGYTGIQIAEQLRFPDSLNTQWCCRGYYGSLSHNVKAIYQRYMGWFDGNPSNLWALPQDQVATNYVNYMGGVSSIVARANADYTSGNFRWVAEVLKHVVALPSTEQAKYQPADLQNAKTLLANALEQLGYQAEAATWRNFYLMGAYELRNGIKVPQSSQTGGLSMMLSMTIEMSFDSVGIRINGDRAAKLKEPLVINWKLTYSQQTKPPVYCVSTVENAALSVFQVDDSKAASLTPLTTVSKDTFTMLMAVPDGVNKAKELYEKKEITGNPEGVIALMALLDVPPKTFPIVTPQTIPMFTPSS